MQYQESVHFLESFINYERSVNFDYKKSFKLERIKEFLETIDNPQDNLKCIHIAGTKGKGSTAVFVSYILRAAGFKTGLYTSPHLSSPRERIRILEPQAASYRQQAKDSFEGMISEGDFVLYVEKLKPFIEKFNKQSQFGELSFFEVYTALAFTYFKEKKIDFTVLETGLGGRLDATNTVNPLICAITQISLEHRHILGFTLGEIAREKAGIIKNNGQIVISSPQGKEAKDVIRRRAQEFKAKLFFVGKDINFNLVSSDRGGQAFNIEGIYNTYSNLRIKLMGRHQVINAVTAVGVIEALKNFDVDILLEAIQRGLCETVWPGRFEIVSDNPYIVLDGAQNVASAKALANTIRERFNSRKKIIVLGISQDKDIEGICNILKNIADKVILTASNNPRAASAKDLQKYFKRDKIIGVTDKVEDAILLAKKNVGKEDVILVTGSLFVVGEARRLLS